MAGNNMTFQRICISVIIGLALSLQGCEGGKIEAPKTARETRAENRGKLTGDNGLRFGGKSYNSQNTGATLGVNSYLWRAALETLSFMPLDSADPFGGVIITDWYAAPSAPQERFKVNVLILGGALRADTLKISVFKQMKKGSLWQDAATPKQLATELEDKILTRARQLRITQTKK